MFCQNCGSQIADGLKFCTECGKPVVAPQPVATQKVDEVEEYFKSLNYEKEYATSNKYVAPPLQDRRQERNASSSASLSIVLGVLGWVLSWFIIPGIVMGIIGIIKATNAKKLGYKGKSWIVGLVFSILALVSGACMLFLMFYYAIVGS